MNRTRRNLAIWLIVLVVVLFAVVEFSEYFHYKFQNFR